jgi:hypothetical protein
VTGFDAKSRLRALHWLRELPGRTWDAAGREPLRMLALLVMAICLWYAVRASRRRGRVAAIDRWLRALRRSRLPASPADTPRELARQARTRRPGARGAALTAAQRQHEADRYAAANPPAPSR